MRITLDIGKRFPEITTGDTDDFASEMLKIEEADFREVILDFSGTESICSMAMGSIFAAQQKLNEEGRILKVANACQKVKRLIEMVNMADLLCDDEEDET